jgi:abequosyltransferase
MRLSVCIPVYNFGAFIGETLDSIARQFLSAKEPVEVVVVDGASVDNTALVVGERVAKWPQLKYVRLPRRGGIDSDLATSVELAQGKYCWLFSGDDIMKKGALETAIRWLDREHDVYISRHSDCDLRMNFLREHPVFYSNAARVAELSNQKERIAYMSEAVTTEAVFSFMSGLIVRRQKWLSVPEPKGHMGSCWAHVARLFTIAESQLRVCYVGETWVDRRGENDSFLEHGVINRLRLAVDGYHRIADQFFGHTSREAAEIRRMVRNDLSLKWWLHAKSHIGKASGLESRHELDRLVAACYSDSNISCWLSRAAYGLTPSIIYRMLQTVRYRLKASALGLQRTSPAKTRICHAATAPDR